VGASLPWEFGGRKKEEKKEEPKVVDFRIVLRDLPELPVKASKYSGGCYRLGCILIPVIEYA
jgi:hypothetical protein